MIDRAYRVIKSFERRLRRKMKGRTGSEFPTDFDPAFAPIFDACNAFTMTGALRMHALFEAVRYIQAAGIEGDIVECGVWRGGSAMVAAMTVLQAGGPLRDIHLYDTYEGMPQPSAKDVARDGRPAAERWRLRKQQDGVEWCFAPLEDVRRNLLSTGYPQDRLHFHEGKVEETIPRHVSEKIALLRLDTDWYESTYHELVHLYPRLVTGGVLILDDYGAWQGARDATDQYLKETRNPLMLCRIDEAARIAVKPA